MDGRMSSEALLNAQRFIEGAGQELRDLAELNCIDADRLATVVSGLQAGLESLATAVASLESFAERDGERS